MAIRVKTTGWEVYYRDPVTGKQRSRFFKEKRDAEREDRRVKYLLEFEPEKLCSEDVDRVVPKKKQVAPKNETPSVYTFRQAFDEYRAVNRLARSAEKELRVKLAGFGFDLYDCDIRLVTQEALRSCVIKTLSRGIKKNTVDRYMSCVFVVLRFAVETGKLSSLPKRPAVPGKGGMKKFVPPNADEINAMYGAASPMQKRIIVLGSKFGLRVGPCELYKLKWSDVDLERFVINVPCSKKNKNVQYRAMPIPESFRSMFTEWKAEDGEGAEYVVHSKKGPYVSTHSGTWKCLLRRAGVRSNIRPYDLRHAFATDLLDADADIGTVAKLMGHANAKMITTYYQYVSDKRKEDVLSRLNPPCME